MPLHPSLYQLGLAVLQLREGLDGVDGCQVVLAHPLADGPQTHGGQFGVLAQQLLALVAQGPLPVVFGGLQQQLVEDPAPLGFG